MEPDVTAYDIWKSLFAQHEPFQVMRGHLMLLIGALLSRRRRQAGDA